MTKIAVVGSRNYQDLMRVANYIFSLPLDYTIVSGGAKGVDEQAVVNAKRRGMQTIVHPADWNQYGKQAGFLRNAKIVADADAVVAFWDGKSKGTAHTIKLAVQAGLVVKIYPDKTKESGNETE